MLELPKIGVCEHVCVSKHVNNSYKRANTWARFTALVLAERQDTRREKVLFHVYETGFACPNSKAPLISSPRNAAGSCKCTSESLHHLIADLHLRYATPTYTSWRGGTSDGSADPPRPPSIPCHLNWWKTDGASSQEDSQHRDAGWMMSDS